MKNKKPAKTAKKKTASLKKTLLSRQKKTKETIKKKIQTPDNVNSRKKKEKELQNTNDLLRKRAEIISRKLATRSKKQEAMSLEKTRKILHELQVHQIELEMQNDELRRAQVELDTAQARYVDLYDLAPVGYCTINEKGLITETNLTAATLLGLARSSLVRQVITRFILKEDQDVYYLYRKKLSDTGELQTCNIRMVKKDGSLFWAHLVGNVTRDEDGAIVCRAVLTDITGRKQAEEKLYFEQQRLRIIAEQSSDIILLLNRRGRIIYENPAVEKILGFNIKKRIGKNAFENIHLDDKNRVKKAFNTFIGEKDLPPRHNEIRIRDINGNMHTFESVSRHLMKDNISEDIIVNLRDITDRKKAEEALRRSEEDYRTLFEQSVDGILIIQESCIVLANQAFCVISGFPLEKAIGANPLDFIHPEDRKMAEQRIGEILSGKQSSEGYVYRAFRTDGSLSWIELRSKLIQWEGKPAFQTILRDITELRKAEEISKKAASEWQSTFDTVSDAICLLDNNQQILRCNHNMAKMFGIAQEKLIGKHCWEIVHDSAKPIPQCPVIRTKSSLVREEMELQMKDRWFNVTADPILDESGSLRGLVHIVRDITERKLAENYLKDTELKFRTIFDSASDGILLAQVSNRKFSTANNKMCEMLGYTNEELLKMGISDIHPKESMPFVSDQFEKLLRKEKLIAHNIPVMRKDKTVFFADVGASPIILDGKDCIIGMFRDITERNRSEEEIKSAKVFLDMIIDMSPFSMWISDKEGTLTRANISLCNTINLTANEIVGKYNVLKDENLEIQGVMPMVRAVFEKHVPARFIIPWKASDAGDVDFQGARDMNIDVSMFPILNAQGELTNVVCQWVDITERKKAEEEIRKLASIVQLSSELVNMTTLDGKMIFLNEAGSKMLGIDQDKIVNYSLMDVIPEQLRQTVQKKILPELLAGNNWEGELQYRNIRTGVLTDVHAMTFPIKDNATALPLYLANISRDITERKKAEKDLQESEIRYRTLFESASDTIFLMDKDIFIDCNQKALDFFGCDKDQIIGQPPYRFSPEIQPDGRESTEKALEKINAAFNGHPQFFEWEHCRYDGSLFDAEISLKAFNDKGKYYIQAICRDITKRKRAEEELKKYREHLEDLVRERTIKLEASNKELEAFSYSASHDLRAPLRTIDGFSQALLEDFADKLNTQGKDYLTRIRNATSLMAELIEDMLKLSRITRAEMDIVNVNLTHIAHSVINELKKSQPERNINIKIADGLEVLADPRLMRIVLENLLGNAWKFTGRQANAEIEVGTTTKDGGKVFFIRDNGVGFDMEYADKLFAPFQRLHNAEEYPGTGVGLATVQRIINRHGGKVWTEGQTGEGATFYFSLND